MLFWTTWNCTEFCRDRREYSHIPLIQFQFPLRCFHLTYCGTFVKTKKPTLASYYGLNSRFYLSFPSVSTDTLFLLQDPIQETTLHLVTMSPQSPLICDSVSASPGFFITLTVLRSTDPVFCRMSPNMVWSGVIRVG